MSNSRVKEDAVIIADIFSRKEIKPPDLPKVSKFHFEFKLGKSPKDHWIKYVERGYGSSVAGNGIIISLIDLIIQASLETKKTLYDELRAAVDNLASGIDPELTRQKLAMLTDEERQIMEEDAKNKKLIEDGLVYQREVRREAISKVFGEWATIHPTQPYEAKK